MKLCIQNISTGYQKKKIIEDMNLEVSGRVIGLLGPNGAGKSTLIKSILGHLPLWKGAISLYDEDDNPITLTADNTGYMPEYQAFLKGMSAVTYLTYMGELSRMTHMEALKTAHIFLSELRVAQERYRKVEELSTGNQQKLKFAQALLHKPSLVFLDEPTNALDPVQREEVLKIITHYAKKYGVTFLISSHILKDLESICDAIIIIQQGKLVLSGSMEELQKKQDAVFDIILFEKDPKLQQIFIDKLIANGAQAEILGNEKIQAIFSDPIETTRIIEWALETPVTIKHLFSPRNSLEKIFFEVIDG